MQGTGLVKIRFCPLGSGHGGGREGIARPHVVGLPTGLRAQHHLAPLGRAHCSAPLGQLEPDEGREPPAGGNIPFCLGRGPPLRPESWDSGGTDRAGQRDGWGCRCGLSATRLMEGRREGGTQSHPSTRTAEAGTQRLPTPPWACRAAPDVPAETPRPLGSSRLKESQPARRARRCWALGARTRTQCSQQGPKEIWVLSEDCQ